MDVEFEDLSYVVNDAFFNFGGERKEILKSVSGKFRAGHLSAILGPSGAGKSSLLNAISGYRCNGVSGIMRVNGQPRCEKLFRKLSCYITQEEALQQKLLVNELMLFAADLKLPGKTTRKQKCQLVHDILAMLGLKECSVTRTEMLSGGQKKRLSIALELINNPPVIFLDEPTSGLDNVSTSYTLRLLRTLAHHGRTIVCTIHQPSASLFQLFDDVYVLSQGLCVYHGTTQNLVPFLSTVGFHCPTHYNPADFVIELTDGDVYANITKLAEATNNGKLSLLRDESIKVPYTPPTKANPLSINNNDEASNYDYGDGSGEEKDELNGLRDSINNNGEIVLRISSSDSQRGSGTNLCGDFPTSAFSQFCTLYRRMMLQMWRNKVSLNIQFYHHLLCALSVSLVFYGKANDGREFFNHLKFCLGVVVFHTFTYCMVHVITYPFEVEIVRTEHFNRWYSLKPYYVAVQLSKLPAMVFFNMIFLSLIYFGTGLPAEWYRFAVFCVIGLLISVAAEGMGFFIGTLFSVINGAAVAPLTLAPFIGLAIYGFDFAKQIPWYISLLMKMSFLRCGLVGIVITIFGMNRSKLHCDDTYCHFADPKILMEYLDIENSSVWEQVYYLIAIAVAFRIGMYVALRWKLS